MEDDKQGYSLKDCLGFLNLGVIIARGNNDPAVIRIPRDAAISIIGFLEELLTIEGES